MVTKPFLKKNCFVRHFQTEKIFPLGEASPAFTKPSCRASYRLLQNNVTLYCRLEGNPPFVSLNKSSPCAVKTSIQVLLQPHR